jgi:hypothetical protein
MDPLPMAPSCALDETGLRVQYERYRQAGKDARLADRTRRRLVVDLDKQMDPKLVDELVAVERKCCPFFELRWEAKRRRLTVSVSRAEDEPALEAIAFALDLAKCASGAAPD